MKRTSRSLVIVLSAATAAACGDSNVETVGQRVLRVEQGMLPAVVAAGEDAERVTIWDIMRQFNVPGVSVAVINEGRLEWAKGYGITEAGGPQVNTETVFLAGHMSQAVAAIGALTLVADGRLDLDENVNDQLTHWRIPDNEFTTTEAVTLRQILTHTSGLSVQHSLGYLSGATIPTLDQVLEGVPPATNEPIRIIAEPGAEQNHSIGGYVVLQQLLENISGSQYSEFIDSVVVQPLGLMRTSHIQPLPQEFAANAATGHEPNNAPVHGRWRTYPELAALGMWTTPSDLAALIIELRDACAGGRQRILSRSLACEMLERQFENRGLGFEVRGDGDWRHIRLEGHGNNYLSEVFAYVSQGMGAVVMTNSSNGEGVKAHILRAIASEYGWPDLLPEEVEVVSLPADALTELTGTYSLRGRDRVLNVENGRLLQSSEGSPDREIWALSDSVLVSPTFGYRYGVDRDESGNITGLTLILNGTRLFTYRRN